MKNMSLLVSAAAAFAVCTLPGTQFAAADAQKEHHWQFSADDAKAFVNSRVAAIKTGLDLTPAQEKNWAPFETALRDQAKARAERFAAWREKRKEQKGEGPDAIARMDRLSEWLSIRAADLKALSTAAKPLYDSLDDAQKRRFGRLLAETSLAGRIAHHWRQVEDEDDDAEEGAE
jgi:hypothetical protein